MKDGKAFHGLYTLMNEHRQVVAFWFIRSGSLEEIRDGLEGLKKRLRINHFPDLQTIYTDRPDGDRSIWESIFTELQPNIQEDPCTMLQVLDNFEKPTAIEYCCSVKELSIAMHKINKELSDLQDNGEKDLFIGFDAEWNISQKKGIQKILTLQLAMPSGFTVIIHLPFIFTALYASSTDPYPMDGNAALILLAQLLRRDDVKKVGINIKGDVTRLKKSIDVEVNSLVNLPSFAVARKVVHKSGMGLREMVRYFFAKNLPKPSEHQMSDQWDKKLCEGKILYAATDAYACVKLYEAIESKKDPVYDHYHPTISQIGSKVWVCNSSNSDVIASGTVIQNSNSVDSTAKFLGKFHQTVTETSRCVVKIDKVLIPGAKISIALRRRKTANGENVQNEVYYSLEEVMEDPFFEKCLLVRKTELRKWSQNEEALVNDLKITRHKRETQDGSELSEFLSEPTPRVKGDCFHLIKGKCNII
jgi:hypothetical protein